MVRRTRLSTGILAASLVCFVSCQNSDAQAQKTSLASDVEKVSYAIGMDIAASLQGFPGELDLASLQQGLADARTGKTTLLSEQEAEEIKQTAFTKMRADGEKDRLAKGTANLTRGAEFLEENKKKDGVVTTESGLQYTFVKQGTGPRPSASDVVTVHYVGTTLDGKEFDSSRKRGEPATFPLSGVIPGWTEGLQLMPVGSTCTLWLPPALAYGDRGAGADIGPNETLIFEVELLSVGQQ